MIARFLLLIACLTSFIARSQNTIGLPDIVNFGKHGYNAGTSNRGIVQDKNGVIYFANNEGLLSFDGTYWKIFPLPNKTIVRSLTIGKDKKIYVGGQDEIGVFAPDANGFLRYTSLKSLIPSSDRTFADIWNVVSVGDDVFFQCGNKVFQYRDQKIRLHYPYSSWVYLGVYKEFVLGQDAQRGIVLMKNNAWEPVNTGKLPENLKITSVTPWTGDTALVTTARHGLFLLSGNHFGKFSVEGLSDQQYFSSSLKIDEETFALGSSVNGCFIINKKGKLIHGFSGKTGLQNSRVLCLFQDQNSNIWLGLENGASLIAYNNAIRHISPPEISEGSGYASAIFQGQLYLGLSNGLFALPITQSEDLSQIKGKLLPVANTENQVWGLNIVNNRLLLGSTDGMFEVNNLQASPLSTRTGFWTFQPLQSVNQTNMVVAGGYQGLALLEERGKLLLPKFFSSSFKESSRFLTIDENNNAWVSHPYRGIYKMKVGNNDYSSVKLYTNQHGLPSALDNHVFRVKNRIVIATTKGIYEYDEDKDRFLPSAFFKPIFDQMAVRYLKEDSDGNIWFIKEKSLGVVDFTAAKPQIIYFPELNRKMVSGFEHIFPINKKNILIGAENGFYHVNFEKYRKFSHQNNVLIRNVQVLGRRDTMLYGGFLVGEGGSLKMPSLDFQQNSFRIEYSAPSYENQANIEYSYQLKGFDKYWSEWSKKTEKEYTQLPAGRYTFQVKARNNLGKETTVSSYTFEILPPWYRTYWAYALYFALLVCGIYFLYKKHQNRLLQQQIKHRKEQEHLQYLHQLEMDKNEQQIIKLKNEKLEAEIAYKNSELASIAMHLAQRGELLSKIKDEMQQINKNPKNEEPLNNLKKVVRILSEEEKLNDGWDQFAVHFDKVHNDFLNIMKEKYPELKPHELKLCAFLRMNLSTKEIAGLMNISVRGVEISRYRLRKKLQLQTEVNLAEFLMSIELPRVGAHI